MKKGVWTTLIIVSGLIVNLLFWNIVYDVWLRHPNFLHMTSLGIGVICSICGVITAAGISIGTIIQTDD